MSSDILEVFRQMSFLTSVIAGFAIAVAVELISLPEKKSLVTATTALFLISAVASIVATFIFILVMTAAIGAPGFHQPDETWVLHFMGGIGVLPLFSILLFLSGIGTVGWIRSKILGIITTTSSIIAFLIILYFLICISAQ
jgi:hypothetical protein